jgi:hypothetical protein
MTVLFTRESDGETIDLTANWQTFTFDEPVTKLRLLITGSIASSPVVEIKLNDINDIFVLSFSNNFEIDGHVIKSISFKRIIGTDGKISILGLKDREGAKIFTRKSYATYEEINGDFNWKTFTFTKPVTKLRLFAVGTFTSQVRIEYKIKGIEGSFILGFANEIDLDEHVVEEVQYRFNAGLGGSAYASIVGFAKY